LILSAPRSYLENNSVDQFITAAISDIPSGSGRSSHNRTEGPVPLHQHEQQATGQSVEAPNVNSLPLDNMLRIVTAVHQFMTEFNGAVSEEGKTVAITKIVSNRMMQNDH
jgi:hypothetical protein